MSKDCHGNSYPVFTQGKVTFCQTLSHAKPAGSVFLLKIQIPNFKYNKILAGQFFMLSTVNGSVLLSRPISIYQVKSFKNEKEADSLEVQFLILQKGQGTKELCSTKEDSFVNLLGPLGNGFPPPKKDQKIAIVGGGIGIAPVAGFASVLGEHSYDFYASFKSGTYGLENINSSALVVTTEDGSVGKKGMLNEVFTTKTLRDKKYDVVYACGPIPMLKYIQSICKEASIKCYLSVESKMACGVGACLGCTIATTEGNRRCCKDGPVFEGEKLLFTESQKICEKSVQNENTAKTDKPENENSPGENQKKQNCSLKTFEISAKNDTLPDLSVNIAGVHFKNPVIAASGTFGFGEEYKTIFDVNRLGGICSKGLTLEAKSGNTGTRLWETPAGLINSIGLENPGIQSFIEEKLPEMKKLKPVCIANLSGHSLETYTQGAKLLNTTDVDIIELNISCPNVKKGGMGFGMDTVTAKEVTKAVKTFTEKPLIVKLTPNAPSVIDVALAVIEAGCNGISLCNTFQAMAIDVEKEDFVFDNKTAGLAGPAIKPIALRIVYDVCKAIRSLPKNLQVPVVGIGGISNWQDAVEFIMAGATAIQVGTATFSNPNCMIEIIEGIKSWMTRKGYDKISDFCGKML
ncbi:MAG: dihydroorotate dehydrogenase [Treponemataceae bacterium]